MAVSRLLMYTKKEGIHRAIITGRTLLSDGVRSSAGEQSDTLGILLSMIGTTDIEGLKSQRRYERLAAANQLSLW